MFACGRVCVCAVDTCLCLVCDVLRNVVWYVVCVCVCYVCGCVLRFNVLVDFVCDYGVMVYGMCFVFAVVCDCVVAD